MYTFAVRNCDWYKRRIPTQKKVFDEVIVRNFVLEPESYCTVIVRYVDESEFKELTGRVSRNAVTNKYTINGINPYGDFILLDVIEV
jgi:hypothetical protein